MNAGTCWGKNTIDPSGRGIEKPRKATLTFNYTSIPPYTFMTCKLTPLTLPPQLTELVVGFKFRINFQVCYLTMLPAVKIIQPW
jgi:hypothetical protein